MENVNFSNLKQEKNNIKKKLKDPIFFLIQDWYNWKLEKLK